MKCLHTSDIHIGKYIHEFSLLEDQAFFLDELLKLALDEKVDAILIAGDLYDRSVPSAEAVKVLSAFLESAVLKHGIPVLAIAGNHDSPIRLDFCADLLSQSQFYIAGAYQANIKKITLHDPYGPVYFYLLPYLTPTEVRVSHSDAVITSFDDAYKLVIKEDLPGFDPTARNVILAHGFFSYFKDPDAVERSESEIHLGGADIVDASIFDRFDFAALGHIHRPQMVGNACINYSGSPLPYSLSEAAQKKSVSIVEIKEKGTVSISRRTLPGLRRISLVEGYFDEILKATPTEQEKKDLYYFTFFDDVLLPGAMNRLRAVYPLVLGLGLKRYEQNMAAPVTTQRAAKPLDELFFDFYRSITGSDPSTEEISIVQKTNQQISLKTGGEKL